MLLYLTEDFEGGETRLFGFQHAGASKSKVNFQASLVFETQTRCLVLETHRLAASF